VAVDQIPETVTLRKLADEYEPVVLPHRKIVLKLAEVNKTSKMAAYYHKETLTLCQGCHHNSPASLTPPQCASCHGKSSEALNLTRPGLMAAYHQQCIECHDQMGLEKPASRDCTACHAKRK
jgi:DnaJ-class molecular chaperone